METRFDIVKTSQRTSPEYLTFHGGSRRTVRMNFSAVLVRHGDDSLLYDSGLGCEIDAQYARDMPRWKRPLLTYGPVDPVKRQLERAEIPAPDRIVLGHAHWDHASGLVDFPDTDVWTTRAERDYMSERHSCGSLRGGSSMPSQTRSPKIKWHEFEFDPVPYETFPRSLDVYADGRVVLVPLAGHTPGSIGMFVNETSGRRALFVGDTVWNARALDPARPKMLLASLMVDSDRAETLRAIEHLRVLAKAQPELVIVPAHDGDVQDRLGYFPATA